MLANYIRAVMRQAIYKAGPDDESIYGEIPGFDRVTATAETLEDCQAELVEALEEWIFFRVSRQLPIPVIDEIEFPINEML